MGNKLHHILLASILSICCINAQEYYGPQNQQQQSAVYCPEPNVRYPHPQQCDVYNECIDGVGSEKVCPDGLLFNSKSHIGQYPCQYPIEVDCEGRTGVQPSQPTGECPHQFAMFKLGDANQCGQYMNCVSGKGFVSNCPEGLAFNDALLQCDWPDQVENCNAEAFLGFSCPITGNSVYDYEAVRKYKHPSDCNKYFQCIKGRPRLANCGGGQAFNEFTSSCDGVENVTGCAQQAGKNYQIPQENQRYSQPNSNLVPDYNDFPSYDQQPQPPPPVYNQEITNLRPPPIYNKPNQNRRPSNFNRPTSNFNPSPQNYNGQFGNNDRSPKKFFGSPNGFSGKQNPYSRRQIPFQSPNIVY